MVKDLSTTESYADFKIMKRESSIDSVSAGCTTMLKSSTLVLNTVDLSLISSV